MGPKCTCKLELDGYQNVLNQVLMYHIYHIESKITFHLIGVGSN